MVRADIVQPHAATPATWLNVAHAVALTPRLTIRVIMRVVPTLATIMVVGFSLLKLAPGDAIDQIMGAAGGASADNAAILRAHYGLDKPVWVQFLAYIQDLMHGNLGWSVRFNAPVSHLIADHAGPTIVLAFAGLVLALAVGVAGGIIMAACEQRLIGKIVSTLSIMLYSAPVFWISLMLIVLFSIRLHWLPSGNIETIGEDLGGIEWLYDRFLHLLLPAISLALFYAALYARVFRGSLIHEQSQDYVRTARAKGASSARVMVRHILPNALLPLSTIVGLNIGSMLGGAVVIETVYDWPGLGRLAYDAIMGRDFIVLLGVLLFASLFVVVANVLTDLGQRLLDPRLRIQ
ncbi:ABC transporter permease [Acetobacter senegalensis]|nr:ABC transporter permease [Acetobacter senegalensis]